MKASKGKRLEAAGWKVGSAREFLALSDEEAVFVELKLTLSAILKKQNGSANSNEESIGEENDDELRSEYHLST